MMQFGVCPDDVRVDPRSPLAGPFNLGAARDNGGKVAVKCNFENIIVKILRMERDI